MADISKISLNGTSYDLKDSKARELLMGKKSIVMIGDSYGIQNTGGGVSSWYWEEFRNTLGLQQNVDFFSRFESGAGFGNNKFGNNLSSVASTISNKEQITDVIVCGGWNDSDKSQSYGTEEAFNEGIQLFRTVLSNNFPKAKVSICHISWGNPNMTNSLNIFYQMPVSIERYKRVCGLYGWNYMSNAEYILHNYDANVWQSDGNHPAQLGQDLLGKGLVQGFINGSCDVSNDFDRCQMTWNSDIVRTVSTGTTYGYSKTNNNLSEFFISDVNRVFQVSTNNISIDCKNTIYYLLGTLNPKFYSGFGAYTQTAVPFSFYGNVAGTTGFHNGSATFKLENGKLYVKFYAFYGGGYADASNVSQLYFTCPHFVSDSLSC